MWGGGITRRQVFIQPLPADIEKLKTRISAAFKESHRNEEKINSEKSYHSTSISFMFLEGLTMNTYVLNLKKKMKNSFLFLILIYPVETYKYLYSWY